ncbi:MAG: hypothetical protein ACYC4L_15250, partial [Chloroflexota bacterium]
PPPTLRLLVDAVTAGEIIRVSAVTVHTVNLLSSTIPAAHERIILRGAVGYACQALANYAINRINTSDEAEKQYTWTGREALRDFNADLKELRRQRTQRAPSTSRLAGYEV